MIEKKIIVCVLMILLTVKVFPQSMTLDEAIRTTATELGQRMSSNRIPNVGFTNQSIEQTASDIRQQLTAKPKIAVLNYSSNWQSLSAYVIDELNNAIVRNGSLTVVDRQQLDLVRQEQNFQMSGDVDDNSAQGIGKFLGAQFVLSGSFTVIGNTNRFRIRVIDVETGVLQYSNSMDITNDPILTALMPKPQPTTSQRQTRQRPVRYEWNFFQKFGIGLLNIPFGIGSYYFEPNEGPSSFWDLSWGSTILITELVGASFGVLFGTFPGFVENDYQGNVGTDVAIGAAIGFGLGATLGFIRGFFVSKYNYTRAEVFPLGINLVSDTANNLGIQMTYKLSF